MTWQKSGDRSLAMIEIAAILFLIFVAIPQSRLSILLVILLAAIKS